VATVNASRVSSGVARRIAAAATRIAATVFAAMGRISGIARKIVTVVVPPQNAAQMPIASAVRLASIWVAGMPSVSQNAQLTTTVALVKPARKSVPLDLCSPMYVIVAVIAIAVRVSPVATFLTSN